MTTIRLLFLTLGLFVCLTAPAFSQIGTQGGPMDITAEHLEVFDAERRAVFSGDVDAAQGESNLRSDRLEVFFSARAGNSASTGSSWGEVDRVIATGEVFYITPSERARGDRAVYQLTSETIVMTGNVTLNRGRDVITGQCLSVDLANGTSQVNAPSCTGEAGNASTSSSNNGRVRAVFFPSSSDADDDDDATGEDADG
jgi:lipopolysaccharide export system protein LptA